MAKEVVMPAVVGSMRERNGVPPLPEVRRDLLGMDRPSPSPMMHFAEVEAANAEAEREADRFGRRGITQSPPPIPPAQRLLEAISRASLLDAAIHLSDLRFHHQMEMAKRIKELGGDAFKDIEPHQLAVAINAFATSVRAEHEKGED